MDKRTISSYHYTGQPVMVTPGTGRNVPEFVRFPAQGQSFYPSYGYGHYGSGYPYQDFYCTTTNYGQQVQDGYLPFNLRSLPNPSSFSQSYNHMPDLQHSYQRTPTPRLYKEPHHENVKHISFTLTPGNDSASCSVSNLETQLAPSTEETADKKIKKKRKKKKKSSSTPNDKAEAEIPNEISVASENLFSSSNSLSAPDLEESNRTGIVSHPGKPEGVNSNKWVSKPIQLYRKQNAASGTRNNYNAEFPSLDNKSTASTQSTETLVQKSRIESATPSFAEKLKKPGENNVPLVRKHAEAPFLDWRDQRTKTVKTSNEKVSSPSVKTETIHIKRSLLKQSSVRQNDQPPSTPHEGSEENKPVEETTSQKDKGWVTVLKHHSRYMQTIVEPEKVKPNAVSVSPVSENEPNSDKNPAVVLTPEARAKLQAKRKAKREKMKGEKKLLRETKIRMERLAPKDQKVRMITPQIMSNYNKPVQNLRPEDYIPDSLKDFPTLEYSSKPNGEHSAPGSSSYSAALQRLTMLTEKVEEPVQACSSSVSKKLKRKDPMEFNLFDTASTKSQLKAAKQERKKNALLKNKVQKFRDAVKIVANPLDSSAPSFSRGKIRQKRKRLTYVEKAQLREKLRKQAVNKMIHEKWDPSDTNLDELIALLGSKLTSQGRIKMKEELEAILALYNAQRAQLASACVPKVPAEGVKLHNRRFRDYCDQFLKDDIDDLLTHLLLELHRFQDRAYNLDPIKARSKRRLLLGLKEVTKQVVRKRVKIVILVPDIQACPGTGGLDEAVARLLDAARSQNLPIIYGLSRRKLGKLLKKNVPASCCGILNYQSMEETFRKLWELVEQARVEYEAKYQQMHEVSSSISEKPNAPIDGNVIEILCDNVQTVSL